MNLCNAFAVSLGCIGAGALAEPITAAIPTPTRDWGCEVLLCLANPAGPTAVAQCVPPIRRLWRHLSRGRAFPTCTMASGSQGRSYARRGYRHYDPCPEGTQELGRGHLAELADAAPAATVPTARSGSASSFSPAAPGYTYIGIEVGDGYGAFDTEGNAPWKICVAGYRGEREVSSGDSVYSVQLYERIYTSPPHPSPNVIDVYIDDRLWHTVRW
jgi:hypothetical protein